MGGTDYSALLACVRREGLFQPRRIYYLTSISVNTALLLLGWFVFADIGDSWWQILTALYLAVLFAQTAFLVHDAGHYQIFRSHKLNHMFGLLYANLTLGMAFGWWVPKHHNHHTHPNTQDLDPDLVNKFIALTPLQADPRSGLHRLTHKNQAALFFPLMLFMALAIHVHSVVALTRLRYRQRLVEALLLGVHLAAYSAAVLVVLSPWRALTFVTVQQGILGLYLGCSFAPNHKGMALWDNGYEVDFLRRQVLSSRNVCGNFLVDLALGGLNYQIEHHLFPNMPRPNLRQACPLVRAFCQDYGISYTETSLFDSFRQTMSYLRLLSGNPLKEVALGEEHAA